MSLFLVWTGLSPLVWEREVTDVDNFGNVSESVGGCRSDGALPYAIVLTVVDLSAMLIALYQSWHARKISLEFSESLHIGTSIALIMVVCFVGIPVIIIASNQPRARFFVLASIIFVICCSLLLFIFVPKEKHRKAKKCIKAAIRSSTARRATDSTQEGNTYSSTISRNSSTDEGDGEGLRVLDSPKAVKDLEEKLSAAKKENATLKKENDMLMKGLVNHTDADDCEANNDEEAGVAAPVLEDDQAN